MPKISGFDESTALTGAEYVPAVQNGGNVKILMSRFSTYVNSFFGTGVSTFLTTPSSANLKAALTDETGSGSAVFATSPTLVTPDLGTPSAGVATNLTGTAAGLIAGNVTTNANLTGVITSSGNTTSIASQTGTGTKFVVDTSPTLVTPVLGVATGTSYNKVTITAPAASATLTLIDGTVLTGPAATGTVMTLGNAETVTGAKSFNDATVILKGSSSGTTILKAGASAGSTTVTLPAANDTLVGKATADVFTNKTFNSTATGNVLQVSGVTVSAGQYPGETTTGSATAGNIGELISSNILTASGVALTTGTPANVTSIALTAGDWDIEAQICFSGNAATTVTGLRGSVSTTSATENTASPNFCGASYSGFAAFATADVAHTIARIRVSLSGSQTYYLVALATFAVNTCKVYGQIRARRVR